MVVVTLLSSCHQGSSLQGNHLVLLPAVACYFSPAGESTVPAAVQSTLQSQLQAAGSRGYYLLHRLGDYRSLCPQEKQHFLPILCLKRYFLPLFVSYQHTPWSPAVHDNVHTHVTYAPVLILVTRRSCVNLANSIKCVGTSCSYLSYRRSHYALLVYTNSYLAALLLILSLPATSNLCIVVSQHSLKTVDQQ